MAPLSKGRSSGHSALQSFSSSCGSRSLYPPPPRSLLSSPSQRQPSLHRPSSSASPRNRRHLAWAASWCRGRQISWGSQNGSPGVWRWLENLKGGKRDSTERAKEIPPTQTNSSDASHCMSHRLHFEMLWPFALNFLERVCLFAALTFSENFGKLKLFQNKWSSLLWIPVFLPPKLTL